MDLPDVQDRRLAERAAAGDDAAFAELVGRHRGALVAFVASRSGRATIAEDAVQEALLSAHRALLDGDPPHDVKAWLHTIAWRRALDLLRRERPAEPADRWETVGSVDGSDAVVIEAAEFARIVRHWRRLPVRQRHALAMSVLEGRSLAEIGRAFGVSPEAAKALVARSRRSLATAMSQRCEDVAREIDRAADAGLRLPPSIRRHVDDCRDCARAHRLARRRRRDRVLLIFPAGLIERIRDAATFATAHEQPVSLVTKVCAGACATALAGGGATAVVVAPAGPPVKALVERVEKPERAKKRAQRKRRPVPTATPAPVATPPPAPAATPAPARRRTTTATTGKRPGVGTVRRRGRAPQPLPTGQSDAPAAPTPEPVPTPQPTPSPQPEPIPAG